MPIRRSIWSRSRKVKPGTRMAISLGDTAQRAELIGLLASAH
jgi:hypothetical protein